MIDQIHFLKKGQKIRALADPPLIRAMPERKRFFSINVFPYHVDHNYHDDFTIRVMEAGSMPVDGSN